MSIEITQDGKPTNVASTKLLYVISGSGTQSNPQYKFIADVYRSGETDRLDRLKTVPNEAGVGVFDIGATIKDDLEFSNGWKNTTSDDNPTFGRLYQVKFGEEWGTSESSSTAVYPGDNDVTPGEPAITSSVSYIFNGLVNPSEYNSFNFNTNRFDTGSFGSVNYTNPNAGYNELRGPKLSNIPYGYFEKDNTKMTPIPINSNDYETVAILNKLTGSDSSYLKTTVAVRSTNNYAELRVIDDTTSSDQLVRTIPVGPKNLSNISASLSQSISGDWNAISVEFQYTCSAGILSSSYAYINETLCGGNLSIPEQTGSEYNLGSWTTKNSVPSVIQQTQGAGDTVGGAWSAGGRSGSDAHTDHFYLFDGTNWSTGPVFPTSYAEGMNVGSQTEAFAIGGTPSGSIRSRETYLYDGVSWAQDVSMINSRQEGGAVGRYAGALVVGGNDLFGSGSILTETWNGSSWTLGPNTPVSVLGPASAGDINDALFSRITKNYLAEFPNNVIWDGTTFILGAQNLLPAGLGAGAGIAGAAITMGGDAGGGSGVTLNAIATPTTEISNGFVWTTVANMSQKRYWAAGAGQATNALIWGGSDNGTYLSSAEEYTTTADDDVVFFPAIETSTVNISNQGLYDSTRFAFINEFGVWDYYTIHNPIRKTTDVTRENVILPLANYSSTTAVYNNTLRSNTQYYAQLVDKIKITTDYIPQQEADWLREIFESPLVYEQIYNPDTEDYEFVPVVITNSQYSWDSGNYPKVFQYTIEYKRANQRRSRL